MGPRVKWTHRESNLRATILCTGLRGVSPTVAEARRPNGARGDRRLDGTGVSATSRDAETNHTAAPRTQEAERRRAADANVAALEPVARPRRSIDAVYPRSAACFAWIAVSAMVKTMSSTRQPRLRSFTGFAMPCNIGPMLITPALRWTAL